MHKGKKCQLNQPPKGTKKKKSKKKKNYGY